MPNELYYEINETEKTVDILPRSGDRYREWTTFDLLAAVSAEHILEGHNSRQGYWELCDESTRQLYAIARDELIERGLITPGG